MKYITIVYLIFVSYSTFSQQIDTVYSYPFRPGTPEWLKLETNLEKYAALQIPETLLSIMNTESLVVSCVNAPYSGGFLAYDGYQTGIAIMISRYNGLQELMKRNDAPEVLLKMYQQCDEITMLIQHEQIDTSFWLLRRQFFEMLLAQDAIINKMDNKEQIELLQEAKRRLILKAENAIGSWENIPSFFIIEKVLYLNKYPLFMELMKESNEIKTSVEIGFMIGDNTLEFLLYITDFYIKNIPSWINTDSFNTIGLQQNYPNPFSETTTIEVFIPVNSSRAHFYLFNNQGVLCNSREIKQRGNVKIEVFRNELKPGVYFYSLIAEGYSILTKQMIINN